MKNALILDPAHGKDTLGKRSPDGKHREYLWSRTRLANIINNTLAYRGSLDYQLYYPYLHTENEPGLINRVNKYNEIAKVFDNTLMISLHNDAYGEGWTEPEGISVWTSKGQDKSDKYATDWYNYFKSNYPNDRFRPSKFKDGDPDKEANFTVIAGNSKVKPIYDSFLIEWRFQSNEIDVEKLMNPVHNEYFEDVMSEYLINLKL